MRPTLRVTGIDQRDADEQRMVGVRHRHRRHDGDAEPRLDEAEHRGDVLGLADAARLATTPASAWSSSSRLPEVLPIAM